MITAIQIKGREINASLNLFMIEENGMKDGCDFRTCLHHSGASGLKMFMTEEKNGRETTMILLKNLDHFLFAP